ncbi:MAG: XTP/dITP diphosphatase [Desulfovibrionaceae bacterium]|nr:XTP/dITP diphosphatase [Desulfovibrionaceae bacterium]MBF0514737.1 XTP/dITP diphosphatase [Desulfovibrionaceae bacterium]
MPETVVLATRNQGKIKELAAMLAGSGIEVLGLDAFPRVGEIAETGASFAENALIKAKAVAAASGLVAVADDSGLEVDALSGAPGVYSARYAGEKAGDRENNAKLLAALAGAPRENRAARFVCAMAACAPNGETIAARGVWEGQIAMAPSGAGGFGYDPLFYDPALNKTAAELTGEEKNARSHRGRALRELLTLWPQYMEKARGKGAGETYP